MPQNSVRLTTNNKLLLKTMIAMCWTHQNALYSQPCHRGFTVQITDSPNMVCTVNHMHAMEELQYKILDFS